MWILLSICVQSRKKGLQYMSDSKISLKLSLNISFSFPGASDISLQTLAQILLFSLFTLFLPASLPPDSLSFFIFLFHL